MSIENAIQPGKIKKDNNYQYLSSILEHEAVHVVSSHKFENLPQVIIPPTSEPKLTKPITSPAVKKKKWKKWKKSTPGLSFIKTLCLDKVLVKLYSPVFNELF